MIKIALLVSFIGLAYAMPAVNSSENLLPKTVVTPKPAILKTTTTHLIEKILTTPTTINFKVVIRDFSLLIPFEKITALSQSLATDIEFQAAINYLASPEWRAIVDLFVTYPPVTKVWNVLRSVGFPLQIQEILCRETTGEPSDLKAKKSLKKYIKGLQELLPCENLKLMFQFKMENDENFKKFHELISSAKMEEFSRDIVQSDQFIRVASELNGMDVPINTVLALIYELMGWKNKPHFIFKE